MSTLTTEELIDIQTSNAVYTEGDERFEIPLLKFTERMRQKLRVNNNKGGWKGNSLAELFTLAKGEVAEVSDELFGGERNRTWLLRVIFECADASNYFMMIADVAQDIMDEDSAEHKAQGATK